MRSALKDQRGGVMAETVIILPLTIAIIFAIFAVSWAATAKSAVMGAARDAARTYAANTWDDPRYGIQGRHRAVAEAEARARAAMRAAGFRPDELTVTIQQGIPDANHVTVQATYTLNLPFWGGAGIIKGFNPTWALSGHAVARLERQNLFH